MRTSLARRWRENRRGTVVVSPPDPVGASAYDDSIGSRRSVDVNEPSERSKRMASQDPDVPEPRRPASEPVYTTVQAMIVGAQLEPGQRVTEEALARDLGVSPTPIREALARLESDGLVTKSHLRGFRVAEQQTSDQYEQMFEIRLLLEPRMARMAAVRASQQEKTALRELEGAIRRTSEKSRGTGTYHEFATLNDEFHQTVAIAAGNALVAATLEHLHVHLHLFRLRGDQGIGDEAVDQALREHEWIVGFIVDGDPDLAEAAMLSHLQRSHARVRDALDTRTLS
jgi:DNA-binding GntR family transcriptional regulator